MKSFKLLLLIATVAVVAIIAYSFSGKDPEKGTTVAKAKEIAKPTDEKINVAKKNSFSVKGEGAGLIENGVPDNNAVGIAQAKSFLNAQIDRRLNELRPFKSKLENMRGIDEQQRKTLVSEVNAEMGNFVALKPEIKKCENKDSLRVIVDKFKAEWLKSRQTAERGNKLMFAVMENKLISDASEASTGLKKRLDMLKAHGKDTKINEKLLAEYNEKLDSAKLDVDASKAKSVALASAASHDERNALLKEKEVLAKNAHEDVRQAYKLIADQARQEFSQRFDKSIK